GRGGEGFKRLAERAAPVIVGERLALAAWIEKLLPVQRSSVIELLELAAAILRHTQHAEEISLDARRLSILQSGKKTSAAHNRPPRKPEAPRGSGEEAADRRGQQQQKQQRLDRNDAQAGQQRPQADIQRKRARRPCEIEPAPA